jgi:hypothetical protein
VNWLSTLQLLTTRLNVVRSLQGSCQLSLFFLGKFVVGFVLFSSNLFLVVAAGDDVLLVCSPPSYGGGSLEDS